MTENEKLNFLSNQVQNCLNELFDSAYNKTQRFIDAVCEISIYLIEIDDKYDYVLKKYNDVTRELLKRMILSNFLEITYYRRKMGIPIDNERISILNAVEITTSLENRNLLNLIYFDAKQLFIMINDVLLYFWHLSPIYSYNIVQSLTKDGFAEKLYKIYPLALSEHMLTLDDSYSQKEFLLYTFYEVLINTTEKIEFSNGEFPVPNAGYTQRIANILKKYNGYDLKLPNIHREILKVFTSRVGINNESDKDKLLIVEIIISTIRAKQTVRFPLDPDEKRLIDTFDKITKSPESISIFYNNNSQTFISILLNNFDCFSNEELLEDLPELKNLQRKKHKDN